MKETGRIRSLIATSIGVKQEILNDTALVTRLDEAARLLGSSFKKGSRVYFCGNGGSAADAQHLAAELSGRFYLERAPLPAEALHVNTSFLTAVANDYSYEEAYERAVRAFGKKGDILIGISTSGNSKNIIRAQKEARKRGMRVISMTGASGGEMKNSADILLNVPSVETPRIQEAHIMLGHILCELVEAKLFGPPVTAHARKKQKAH